MISDELKNKKQAHLSNNAPRKGAGFLCGKGIAWMSNGLFLLDKRR